ncbi:MAG: chromosomal replication initiator protein DnaA [Desulfovibrio sp.]|uniref:chromosomal replication initiator protein DnaA n=1 Tax=Desulfovibrio sp. 7SRBS1 TaxID=3378064 RepID=UPI003B3F95F7
MKHEWDHVQQILESRLNPGLYKVWIKPLSGKVNGKVLELTAPNGFVASWVRDRLLDSIEDATCFALGQDMKVCIQTAAPKAAPRKAKEVAAPKPSNPKLSSPASNMAGRTHIIHSPYASTPLGGPGTYRPTDSSKDSSWLFNFDDFVVGPSNQLAHAASMGICQNSLSVDKLFLSSAPGLGKTHLIQAIGNELASQANRSVRVRYLTAEEFATCMVVALKMRDIERFKSEFRDQVDLLLLEDIHFLQGKEKIQGEMLATLKALQSRGSKVVFTSSFLPRELSDVDDQLVSRFSSGFLANIEAPDFETRRRIIEFKANNRFMVDIPTDVSALLAERIDNDIRQLESCLKNLVLKAKLMNEKITLEMAEQILANYASHLQKPDLERIIRCVCEVFSLTPPDLSSKSRKQQIVTARNTAFFLARRHTDLSLKDIGQKFNRRHSTVLKGITRLEREVNLQTPKGRQIQDAMNRMPIAGC